MLLEGCLFWSLTYSCDLLLLCKVVLKNTREQWWQRQRHCQRGKICNFKLQDCILQAEVTSQGCILNLADAWEGAVGGWRRPKL